MGTTPAGWYPDPDDPALLRFWDGGTWTDSRRSPVADPNEPTTSLAAPSGQGGRRGLAAARRLADSAKQSSVARKVADGASSLSRGVIDTAKDPARRQTAIRAAIPAFDAALEGAGVRNKDGKVKVWRLARAAARPRKTVSRAGRAAAAATAGQLKTGVGSVDRQHGRLAPRDAEIVAEWAFDDPGQDLARWREGLTRFADADVTDTAEMRTSAYLMCDVLKHCVIGDPILDDDDEIVETIGNVLAALLHGTAVDDWEQDDEKVVRLGLAVARRFGVQPEELGGNGELDALFYDSLDRMRMAMAIARSKWSCDMSAWFADAEPG